MEMQIQWEVSNKIFGSHGAYVGENEILKY